MTTAAAAAATITTTTIDDDELEGGLKHHHHHHDHHDHHDDWRIALYYCYVDLDCLYDNNIQTHVEYQQNVCKRMDLNGRIRVSTEGINGVLSGKITSIQNYEKLVTMELSNLLKSKQQNNNVVKSLKNNATDPAGQEEEDEEEAQIDDDDDNDNNNKNINSSIIDLDIKYCFLRKELPIKDQLFDSLIVKETKTVITLCDSAETAYFDNKIKNNNKQRFHGIRGRNRRRQQQKQQERQKEGAALLPFDWSDMIETKPSPHLSSKEWNDKLDSAGDNNNNNNNNNENGNHNNNNNNALLVDVRNVYESRVGHFATKNVPTLLTNTRKYSDLPTLLATNPEIQNSQQIFMYCTGGVRCERVSQMVQTLYPTKEVYQLKGGIQTYLREVLEEEEEEEEDGNNGEAVGKEKQIQEGNVDGGKEPNHAKTTEGEETTTTTTTSTNTTDTKTANKFLGKNFVFDQRRTDPVHSDVIVGSCLICNKPHDDYDNGHAPNENKEARCNTCRMLILVCDDCRPNYLCHGENYSNKDDGKEKQKPLLYCGGLNKCVHEGAAPEPELIRGGGLIGPI